MCVVKNIKSDKNKIFTYVGSSNSKLKQIAPLHQKIKVFTNLKEKKDNKKAKYKSFLNIRRIRKQIIYDTPQVLREKAKKKLQLRLQRHTESIKKLVLNDLFCLNVLSTKTNHFCSITTYMNGHVLFLGTPRMQGFKHTMRRKDIALQATLQLLFRKFFKVYTRRAVQFIIQFSGKKSYLIKKIVKLLLKKIRLKRHQIYLIKWCQFFAHNGCKRQVRRRKKRKGRRKIFKPIPPIKKWKAEEEQVS